MIFCHAYQFVLVHEEVAIFEIKVLLDALFVLIFKQSFCFTFLYEFKSILFFCYDIASPERDAIGKIDLNIHLFKIEVLLV